MDKYDMINIEVALSHFAGRSVSLRTVDGTLHHFTLKSAKDGIVQGEVAPSYPLYIVTERVVSWGLV